MKLLSTSPAYRQFYVGMAMSAPFVASLLPFPVTLLASLALLPWLLHLMRVSPRWSSRPMPKIVWVTLFLIVLHLLQVMATFTPYRSVVVRDLVIAVVLLAIFISGNSRTRDECALCARGFFVLLVPVGASVAILGLVKLTLLNQGILIGFLLDLYPDEYPWGTSLRRDYNLFGLSVLAAGVGSVTAMHSAWKTSAGARFALNFLAASTLGAAAYLSGSRRTLLLCLALPCLWIVLVWFERQAWRAMARGMAFLPAAIAVSAVIVCGVLEQQKSMNYQVLGRTQSIVALPGDRSAEKSPAAPGGARAEKSPAPPGGARAEKSPAPPGDSRADSVQRDGESPRAPTVIADGRPSQRIDSFNKDFGFESRIARWKLGMDLIRESRWFGAAGFSYHETFSCAFVHCTALDYPHFVVISEWLIGGLPGLLAILGFFLLLGHSIFRTSRNGWVLAVTTVGLITVPYALISGDSVFSLPQLLAIALLLQHAVDQERHGVDKTIGGETPLLRR